MRQRSLLVASLAGCSFAGRLLVGLALAGTGWVRAQTPPEPVVRPLSITTPAQAGSTIKAPYYGDTLFHFFQDRSFDALTGLMVSQHFKRVDIHADEAEVLRGGLLLAYGLHDEAGAIFARLIDSQARPAVRDRAWFFLAKMRHQRGQSEAARAALERIGDALPAALGDEHLLLRSNVLLALGDAAGAAAWLQAKGVGAPAADPKKPFSAAQRYARYNLGVAWVRSAEAARGLALLAELGQSAAYDDEQWTLRDKANVALGYAALAANAPADARTALQRVRLAGPSSSKALLGFGWAAAALKQPKDALVPWLELVQRPADDAAVLEARIAVPYAWAEAGVLATSLKGYEDAVAGFEGEARALDQTIAAVRNGRLLDALLERQPTLPQGGHLNELMSSHGFHEALTALRDLQHLDRNLKEWADKISVYGDMLAHRRQAYADRLPKVLERARRVNLPALEEARSALATDVARAEAQADDKADGSAYADARERDLMQRLARVRKALAEADAELGPDAAVLKERARLAAGALVWQQTQALPERRWQVRREMLALERAGRQAADRTAALAQAQKDEPARFDAFGTRLAALDARLRGAMPVVARLATEQRAALQQMTVAQLEVQKERLAQYAAQARFAIAQLVDRALVAQDTSGKGGTDAVPR